MVCIILATFLATILSLFSVGFLAELKFDQLLKYQHKYYNTEWKRAGRPHGYWRVPGGSLSQGRIIRMIWSVSTPDWMRNDEWARVLFKRSRNWSLVGICLFILLIGEFVLCLLNPHWFL